MQDEPFAERTSDVFGVVQLHAPPGPPSEWGRAGWLLMTQHGVWERSSRTVMVAGMEDKVITWAAREDRSGPGMRVLVRSERVWEAFQRPGALRESDLWVNAHAEVEIAL